MGLIMGVVMRFYIKFTKPLLPYEGKAG